MILSDLQSSYRVIIDSNNSRLILKLLYYLRREQLMNKHSEFILETDFFSPPPTPPTLLFIPIQPVVFEYENHGISVEYKKTKESSHYTTMEIRYDQITVTSDYSFDHLYDFLSMITGINISEGIEVILSKYVWSPESNEWFLNRRFKKRSLDSIYFHQKQKIVDTLQYFLNDSETQSKYETLGIPYKKIFLFHGIPGTGKTSFIQALASHFDYHLSVVQTLPKTDDIALESMVSSLRKKSFLVFEDIDTLLEYRKTNNKTNITFGGLLNMLDGIGCYDKLVIFITTNVFQQLDPAFRRRIDSFVEFGYMQKSEIVEMHHNFFNSTPEQSFEFYKLIKAKKITANTLEKFFMECLSQRTPPEENLKGLDEYNTLVSEKEVTNLYG